MTMIDGATRPEPEPSDEIGGDPCGDLLPGDESLPLAAGEQYPFIVRKTLLEMQEEIFDVNVANGWFEDDRRFGEDVALLHSEASEMLEAFRDYGLADVTEDVYHPCSNPQHGDSTWDHDCDDHYTPGKPEGVGSEAADVLIRLLDTCKRTGIDLDVEYARKIAFNKTRGYKHGGKSL